jgi:hypothetical protein
MKRSDLTSQYLNSLKQNKKLKILNKTSFNFRQFLINSKTKL